ncbi:MAG: ion channel [Gemmatimonadales bacterium]
MAISRIDPSIVDKDDPGFGSRVGTEPGLRLVNRDGSFNVARKGLPFFQSFRIYQLLLNISWTSFTAVLVSAYVLANVMFATAYMLAGSDAIAGAVSGDLAERFLTAFFFSVQTITTVGYGHLYPNGIDANLIVAIEAFMGMAGIGMIAALVFARVSRPAATIIFSNRAVIEPGEARSSFKLRLVNGGRSELVDVEVRVLVSLAEMSGKLKRRRFHELKLERSKLALFPLHWTVVHSIDESSPLHDLSSGQLRARGAEFIVFVNATDDTFSQRVHTWFSYVADEVEWDAKFTDMYRETRRGRIRVDVRRIHDIEHVESPSASFQTVWDV